MGCESVFQLHGLTLNTESLVNAPGSITCVQLNVTIHPRWYNISRIHSYAGFLSVFTNETLAVLLVYNLFPLACACFPEACWENLALPLMASGDGLGGS